MYNFLRKKIRENSVRVLGDLGFDRCGSPFFPWSLEDEARKGRKKRTALGGTRGGETTRFGSVSAVTSSHPHTHKQAHTHTLSRPLCSPSTRRETLFSRSLCHTTPPTSHTLVFSLPPPRSEPAVVVVVVFNWQPVR